MTHRQVEIQRESPRKPGKAVLIVPAGLLSLSACFGPSPGDSVPPPGSAAPIPTVTPSFEDPWATAPVSPDYETPTTPPDSLASPSPTAVETPPPAPSDTNQSGPECTTSMMLVSASSPQTAQGHSSTVITFKNVSGQTCVIQGYPDVWGMGPQGERVVAARQTPQGYSGGLRSSSDIPVMAVQPDQTISAVVEGTSSPTGNCQPLGALAISMPNSNQYVYRADTAPADCSGLEVHPLLPGNLGSE